MWFIVAKKKFLRKVITRINSYFDIIGIKGARAVLVPMAKRAKKKAL
jgi:hypothetical protein